MIMFANGTVLGEGTASSASSNSVTFLKRLVEGLGDLLIAIQRPPRFGQRFAKSQDSSWDRALRAFRTPSPQPRRLPVEESAEWVQQRLVVLEQFATFVGLANYWLNTRLAGNPR